MSIHSISVMPNRDTGGALAGQRGWTHELSGNTKSYLMNMHGQALAQKVMPSGCGSSDFPLPGYFIQLILADPKAFPGKRRDIVALKCPGSSPSQMSPKHLPREFFQETSTPDARATSLGSSQSGGAMVLLFFLPNRSASHFISNSQDTEDNQSTQISLCVLPVRRDTLTMMLYSWLQTSSHWLLCEQLFRLNWNFCDLLCSGDHQKE
uniref:uncharacterized protein LOC131127754 n=1 Tax=Doryrhamphus excisus TaxID=161450 RepID=UPI0025AE2FB2|nr:uncharacterized protein LOC131127754 [Doryrhamphus excisus]